MLGWSLGGLLSSDQLDAPGKPYSVSIGGFVNIAARLHSGQSPIVCFALEILWEPYPHLISQLRHEARVGDIRAAFCPPISRPALATTRHPAGFVSGLSTTTASHHLQTISVCAQSAIGLRSISTLSGQPICNGRCFHPYLFLKTYTPPPFCPPAYSLLPVIGISPCPIHDIEGVQPIK